MRLTRAMDNPRGTRQLYPQPLHDKTRQGGLIQETPNFMQDLNMKIPLEN